ncbi:MAG: Hpt domain-containing protein [Bacteroidota bacterium]
MANDLVFLREHASGDVLYLKEIIVMYLRTMPEYFRELKENFNSKNWIEVSNQAHKMKSPAKLFGDLKLESLLNEIEFEGKEIHVKEELIVNKINEISQSLSISFEELNAILIDA